MKNKLSLVLPFFATLALLAIPSCKDIIEADLSKTSITIVAPSNNVTSTSFTQLFKWNAVTGADTYELEIAKPNFDTIIQFILDSTMTATQYSYTLPSGTYQWRVRAKNGSSTTNYVTYNLKIDSSLNLSSQQVPLSNPQNNVYSNTFVQTFSWQTLPSASYYIFNVLVNGTPVFTKDTTSSSITYKFLQVGTYDWNVLAYNSSSNSTSSGSNIRTITIDTAKPAAPVIAYLPLNDTTSKNPLPLAWNSVETNATYEVIISTDSSFTNAAKTVKDTITSNLTYNFYNAIIAQSYFWKIRTIDPAKNVGVYSSYQKIIRE